MIQSHTGRRARACRRLSGLAMLGVALAVGWALPVRAQDGAPPLPRVPRTVADVDAWRPPVTAAAERPVDVPPLEGTLSTQGRIAFQSFRDGNWEIYLGDADTLSVQRLTHDDASDLEPRISPDMSQIVFTSRRTGNYELFAMTRTGEGLRQLTFDPATDSSANWSPDGRRIVFQSDRGGNTDVYVMNADGTGLTRLTTQPGYDGEPAWSPDGRQIAFVSRRSTGDLDYHLFIMDANGGQQRLLTAVPYSSHPAWSYGGQRILFDGLGSSGWQRLYIYDLGKNVTREVGGARAAGGHDYAGAWGPGDTFYYTYLYYIQEDGAWTLSSMTVIRGWDDSTNGALGFGPVDGFPSFANPDRAAPATIGFTSQSLIRRTESPFIWFMANEGGQAPAAGLDIQHRTDSGAWSSSLLGCLPYGPGLWRCMMYPPDGAEFDVRGRGFDASENRAEWGSASASEIRIQAYERLIFGSVRDQKGLGLGSVPVTGINAYETPLITDRDGTFVAHQRDTGLDFDVTAQLGDATATVAAADFSPLNGTDRAVVLRPPPVGNVLGNAGFTTPGDAWLPVSGLPLGWPTAPEADSPVLRLAFPDPVIDTWSDSNVSAVVAITGTTEFMTFRDYTVNRLRICPLHQACSLETLSNDYSIAMAINDQGQLGLLTSSAYQDLVFRLRGPSGGWSAPESVPIQPNYQHAQLLADHQGRWILVWYDGYGALQLSVRSPGGGWSLPVNVASTSRTWDAVIDATNGLHIVGCLTGGAGVQDLTWTLASGFGVPTPVSAEACSGGYQGTWIDSSQRLYALWSTLSDTVTYSRRAPNGMWSDAVPLLGETLASPGGADGTDGRPVVAVTEPGGGWTFRQPADDQTWQALPYRVTWPGAGAFLTLRAINWAVPSVTAANFTQLWRHRLSITDRVVGAAQVVTVPADLHQPILSINYRFMQAESGDRLTLSIQAIDDAAPTLVDLPTGPDWQQRWRDVSAWAGKSVTVTVRLEDGPGGASPLADINEIYLAAWTTPAVQTVELAGAAAPAATVTVTGDNFMPGVTVFIGDRAATTTWIDAHHLSVVLPADASPGWHRVVVRNPGGYVTASADLVQIGQTLELPAVLRWSLPISP